MKRIPIFLLVVLLTFFLSACQRVPVESMPSYTPDNIVSDIPDSPAPSHKGLIGVKMSTNAIERWVKDGEDIKQKLETKGYAVELMYDENDIDYQMAQLIAKDCKVLVIASPQYSPDIFEPLKKAGITIISYYFIDDYMNVDYYINFDYYRVGALQAEYIVDALGLKEGKGPFNIELFTGCRYDANIAMYHKDAMKTLRPYIENGQLVVKSGQVDINEIAVDDYKAEIAKDRMDSILAMYYTNDKLDAVLCPFDPLALGVIDSLTEAGYTEFPIITGFDCHIPNVMAMKAGKQSMSVFWDTRILTAKIVEMVDTIMAGGEVPVNYTYEIGGKQIPTFLCEPCVVTVDNIKEILIDGGYYTESDLQE